MRIIFAALVASAMTVVATAQLPPEARRDVLLTQLENGLSDQDWSDVIASVEGLRELELPLPAIVDLYEGEALLRSGRADEALASLERYISAVGSGGDRYGEAIELYLEAEQEAPAARARREQEIQRLQSIIIAECSHNNYDGTVFRPSFSDDTFTQRVYWNFDPRPESTEFVVHLDKVREINRYSEGDGYYMLCEYNEVCASYRNLTSGDSRLYGGDRFNLGCGGDRAEIYNALSRYLELIM